MVVAPETFWVPGGAILNKPRAQLETCIPCSVLSEGSLVLLRDSLTSEHRWPAQFKLVMDRIEEAKLRWAACTKSSGSRSSEVESVYSIPEDTLRVDDDDSLVEGDGDGGERLCAGRSQY